MDLARIIESARMQSRQDVADKNILPADFLEQYPDPAKQVRQDAVLMNYFETLLETYHQELKEVLAKQGIEI